VILETAHSGANCCTIDAGGFGSALGRLSDNRSSVRKPAIITASFERLREIARWLGLNVFDREEMVQK